MGMTIYRKICYIDDDKEEIEDREHIDSSEIKPQLKEDKPLYNFDLNNSMVQELNSHYIDNYPLKNNYGLFPEKEQFENRKAKSNIN